MRIGFPPYPSCVWHFRSIENAGISPHCKKRPNTRFRFDDWAHEQLKRIQKLLGEAKDVPCECTLNLAHLAISVLCRTQVALVSIAWTKRGFLTSKGWSWPLKLGRRASLRRNRPGWFRAGLASEIMESSRQAGLNQLSEDEIGSEIAAARKARRESRLHP